MNMNITLASTLYLAKTAILSISVIGSIKHSARHKYIN